MGAEDKLVGCTVYCQKPDAAKDKPKVGTAIDVDMEKVVTLAPDLVLATSLTDVRAKEKMRGLGIKVLDFPAPKDFEEVCGQFLRVGEITGKMREAEEILRKAREAIGVIKERTKGRSRPKVFVQLGAAPLVTVTKDSFVNDFIEFAGGINIARNLSSDRYSRERVIADNPDVIIIVTMGIKSDEEMKNWQKHNTVSAVKDNRIYIVDSGLMCSPTPLSFVEATKKIERLLHGD